MTSAFALIGDDFRRELGTIRDLLTTCYGSASAPAAAVPVRIASSNACVLLLGASYEEFARELVREYATALIAGTPPLTNIPQEFVAAVWERTTYELKGAKFGKAEFDPSRAAGAIIQLQKFCLAQDRSAAVAETVAYNENNLRPKELNILFKRIGLPNYCETVGVRPEMVDFFGAPDGASAHGRMINFLDEFYDTRNEVAHSIGSLKVTGVSNLARYIDFFECFAHAAIADLTGRTTPTLDDGGTEQSLA